MEADAVYLSFSVGAINGFAHIGVLHALEVEYALRGKDLHRCIRGASGASAGAMMALATVLGFRGAELKRFADEQLDTVADEFKKPNLVHLYRTGSGMLKPDPIRRVLRAMIERKLGVTDITFEELGQRLPGMQLWIAAHNIDDLRGELFSVETSPHTSVVEACTASCMVPVIFESVEVDGTMYVDGGISNSLPFKVFDDPYATIKVYLRKLPPPRHLRKEKPLSFLRYLSRVVEAFETATRVRLEHDTAPHNQINILLPLESVSADIENHAIRDRLYWYGALMATLWAHPEYTNGITALIDMPLTIQFSDVDAMYAHTQLVDTSFVSELTFESEEEMYDALKRILSSDFQDWNFKLEPKSPYSIRVVWVRVP
jgi:predicted acylesterase/phospholipase RssA